MIIHMNKEIDNKFCYVIEISSSKVLNHPDPLPFPPIISRITITAPNANDPMIHYTTFHTVNEIYVFYTLCMISTSTLLARRYNLERMYILGMGNIFRLIKYR